MAFPRGWTAKYAPITKLFVDILTIVHIIGELLGIDKNVGLGLRAAGLAGGWRFLALDGTVDYLLTTAQIFIYWRHF